MYPEIRKSLFFNCKNTIIGPVKHNFSAKKWDYFLIHQFKHVFLDAQKNRLNVLVKNSENSFQLHTLIWRPVP